MFICNEVGESATLSLIRSVTSNQETTQNNTKEVTSDNFSTSFDRMSSDYENGALVEHDSQRRNL